MLILIHSLIKIIDDVVTDIRPRFSEPSSPPTSQMPIPKPKDRLTINKLLDKASIPERKRIRFLKMTRQIHEEYLSPILNADGLPVGGLER